MGYKWVPLQTKGFYPLSLYSHSTVAYNDKIYVYGGITSMGCTNSLFVFNIFTNRWKEINNLQLPYRFSHTAIVYKNKMIIFGGNNKDYEYTNTLFELNLDNLNIQRLAKKTLAPPRANHSAVVEKDRMIIFGGNNYKFLNDLHIFNLKSHEWCDPVKSTGQIPSARSNHCAFIYKENMYVYGGKPRAERFEIYALNIHDFHWKCIQTSGMAPSARFGFTLLRLNCNCMLLFGGMDTEHYRIIQQNNDLFKLNISNLHWEKLHPNGSLPDKRHKHTGVVIGNKMFILSGFKSSYENYLLLLPHKTQILKSIPTNYLDIKFVFKDDEVLLSKL